MDFALFCQRGNFVGLYSTAKNNYVKCVIEIIFWPTPFCNTHKSKQTKQLLLRVHPLHVANDISTSQAIPDLLQVGNKGLYCNGNMS